jgi:hypothetical protein
MANYDEITEINGFSNYYLVTIKPTGLLERLKLIYYSIFHYEKVAYRLIVRKDFITAKVLKEHSLFF